MNDNANPKTYIEKLAEAQNIRNNMLGDAAFSDEELLFADEVLSHICSTPKYDPFIIDTAKAHEYVRSAIVFTWGWYSDRAIYQNPEKPPLRAQISKVVLFREYYLRVFLGDNQWAILDSICNTDSLREYAESGCNSVDLGAKHYFMHSSLSSKWLDRKEYLEIDRNKWGTILYPMYEAEIISAIVALIAAAFGVEWQLWRTRRRDKEKKIQKAIEERKVLEKRISELEKKVDETYDIIKQMLLEIELRQTFLLEQINDRLGRISRLELADIYSNSYIPVVKQTRNSLGKSIPKEAVRCNTIASEYAKMMAPQFCKATTKEGKRCNRVVPGGVSFCWQHS